MRRTSTPTATPDSETRLVRGAVPRRDHCPDDRERCRAFPAPLGRGDGAIGAALASTDSASEPWLTNFSVRPFSVTVRTTESGTPDGDLDLQGHLDLRPDEPGRARDHLVGDAARVAPHASRVERDGPVKALRLRWRTSRSRRTNYRRAVPRDRAGSSPRGRAASRRTRRPTTASQAIDRGAHSAGAAARVRQKFHRKRQPWRNRRS